MLILVLIKDTKEKIPFNLDLMFLEYLALYQALQSLNHISLLKDIKTYKRKHIQSKTLMLLCKRKIVAIDSLVCKEGLGVSNINHLHFGFEYLKSSHSKV